MSAQATAPITLRFVGEKREIRPWNLHRTHTTCYAEVRELASDALISRAVVRFALRELRYFTFLPDFTPRWLWRWEIASPRST